MIGFCVLPTHSPTMAFVELWNKDIKDHIRKFGALNKDYLMNSLLKGLKMQKTIFFKSIYKKTIQIFMELVKGVDQLDLWSGKTNQLF